MRKSISIACLIALFLGLGTSSMFAQDTEQEVTAFIQKYQEAFNNKDFEALASLYAHEIVEIAPDGTSKSMTQADVMTMLKQRLEAGPLTIDIKLTRMIAQVGGKVKIWGNYTLKGINPDNGESTEMTSAFEHQIVQKGRDWKLCELKTIQE